MSPLKKSKVRSDCPLSTQDPRLDADRRAHAESAASYGPENPGELSVSFWKAKAQMWGTDQAEARTMRCENCGAFDASKDMLICISRLPSILKNAAVEGNVGFCDAYEFRATAKRVCDSWVPRTSARH